MNKENVPEYIKVSDWLRYQVTSHKLIPGQKIYSENELCRMFCLSRQTIRHSINILINEEILESHRGSGTYVCDPEKIRRMRCAHIAVITTYVDTYIFPNTIRGIEDVLSKNGYTVQISFTNNEPEREGHVLEDILKRHDVSGIIIEATKSSLPNMNRPLFRELQRRNIPLIFINSYYSWIKAPHVTMNDARAGYRATKYLISKGHRIIGGIFKADDGQGNKRYSGYCRAMSEAGLAYDTPHVIWIDTEDVRHIEDIGSKLKERLRDCTGVLCYNDEVARALIRILDEFGIKVPDDLSIVSIDNSDLAKYGGIKLTSFPHPMEKLGETAATNLIRLIHDPDFDASYEFDESIIERESVKDINKPSSEAHR